MKPVTITQLCDACGRPRHHITRAITRLGLKPSMTIGPTQVYDAELTGQIYAEVARVDARNKSRTGSREPDPAAAT
jgi:hypothetical protein